MSVHGRDQVLKEWEVGNGFRLRHIQVIHALERLVEQFNVDLLVDKFLREHLHIDFSVLRVDTPFLLHEWCDLLRERTTHNGGDQCELASR